MSSASSLRALFAVMIMALPAAHTPARRLVQQTSPPPPPQKPTPSQMPPPGQEPETVVRINTQLVQIDAVVTNKQGGHVDTLNEEDFELFVDGKRQTLTHFALVKLPEAKRETKAEPKATPARPAGLPNQPIAPEQVRRTIAFVVDDLGLSFESTYYARRAIKKFVDEQMQDGDLVGIVRTGRGLGALQQFTSDRRILYAAIEKLTWNPYSRNMLPRFGNDSNGPAGPDNEAAREATERFEDFRETVFSFGTLGALNFVVRGLRELPGRKMAILISDGFRLFGRNRDNNQVLERVRRLVDLANRSSVVIYSLDARGLQVLMPSAADNMSGLNGQQIADQISRAHQENFESQDGLVYVARETGGFAVLNNNDLNFGVQRVLRDNQSYYLLGFDPEDQQFNGRYHSIKVRVKQPGLQVRTRAGFFGVPDREVRERPRTREAQIVSALFSPFGARDLQLQMTSFFFNSAQGGSFVRSLFHFDCSKLTFKPGENGEKVTTADIATFTFNENGQVIEQLGRTFSLRLNDAQYRAALAKGLVYTHDTPIKKPGAYQFRAVLRDAETGRLGSAGQFIQVPDLTKDHLALSGLTLTAPLPNPADKPSSGSPQPPAQANAQAQAAEKPAASSGADQQPDPNDPQPTPAVRRFARRGDIEYAAVIYNARLDKQTSRPKLTTRIEIYRDGKPIYQASDRPLEVAGQPDLKRIVFGGGLRLSGLAAGDYVLHVVINDTLAKPKYAHAEQWMDFSVR